MSKIIKLTEKELTRLVKKVINEQGEEMLPPATEDDIDLEILCELLVFFNKGKIEIAVDYQINALNRITSTGNYHAIRFNIDSDCNVTTQHGEELGYEDITDKSITRKVFTHFEKNFGYDVRTGKAMGGYMFIGDIKMDGSIHTKATLDYLD